MFLSWNVRVDTMSLIAYCRVIVSVSVLICNSWQLSADYVDGRLILPSSRVVSTKKGSLRGSLVTWEDKQLSPVEMFLGIPYASPPVGSLRFMPPVTAAPWRGTRNVDKLSAVCPQKFPDIRNETEALKRMPRGRLEMLKKMLPLLKNQSEDCLYLNIYTPHSGSAMGLGSTRYPVMVFLHGESYSWGSGNLYDGSLLAAYGKVVVVTLNYRLGALGFLNPHHDPYSRSISNYGLMDQIAALHWLQENVAEFGGDSSSVTLMGHGTGAACAAFLMTSPAVLDGLFQRAILLSGTSLSPWALVQEPWKQASEVARQLNCSSHDLPTFIHKCLRERSAFAIASSITDPPEFLPEFGPSVDGVVIEDDYLNNPKKLSEKLSRYDVVFGVTQSDSYFVFSAEDNQYGIESDRRNRLLRTFVRNTYQFHLQEILATIVNEYTDWEKPVVHPINIRDETLEALTDAQYVAPLVRTGDLHSALRHASYFYVFDYQTKASDYPQRLGCVHGEELPYIFGAPLLSTLGHWSRNYTKSEVALSETVIAYWTNFARTGNPNEASPGYRDKFKVKVDWAPFEKQHRRYLSIGLKPKSKGHYRSHKLALWINLIPDLHRPTGVEVARDHHLLDDYDDPLSYDGKVRLVPATVAIIPTTTAATPALNSSLLLDSSTNNKIAGDPREIHSANLSADVHNRQEESFGAYSTALSVTIAIGCSLLILNVLIFAGVYYQRDKQRMELKRRVENGLVPMSISGEVGDHTPTRPCTKPDLADLPSLQRIDASMMNLTSPFGSNVAQLPPPEFADYPQKPNGGPLVHKSASSRSLSHVPPNQDNPMKLHSSLKRNHKETIGELRV